MRINPAPATNLQGDAADVTSALNMASACKADEMEDMI